MEAFARARVYVCVYKSDERAKVNYNIFVLEINPYQIKLGCVVEVSLIYFLCKF